MTPSGLTVSREPCFWLPRPLRHRKSNGPDPPIVDSIRSVGNAYCLLDSGDPVLLSSEEYSPLDSQMIAELEDFVMAGDQ